MLFIFLFVIGVLAVPLAADISRHGSDNIFRRSGRDVLEFPWIQAIFRFFNVTVSRVNTAAMGLISFFVVLAAGYFLLWLVRVLAHLITKFF